MNLKPRSAIAATALAVSMAFGAAAPAQAIPSDASQGRICERLDRFSDIAERRITSMEARIERMLARAEARPERAERLEIKIDRIETRIERVETRLERLTVRCNGEAPVDQGTNADNSGVNVPANQGDTEL